MIRLFLLYLFVVCGSLIAKAQTGADSTDNRLKAGLWSLTATRIYDDQNIKPVPRRWKSYASFKSWVNEQGKKDRSGLVGLWTVILKNSGITPVSPRQLADKIIEQVRYPTRGNKSSFKKVNSDILEADLNRFLAVNSLDATAADESLKKGTVSVKGGDNSVKSKPRESIADKQNGKDSNEAQIKDDDIAAPYSTSVLLLVAVLVFSIGAIAGATVATYLKRPSQAHNDDAGYDSSRFVPIAEHKVVKDQLKELLVPKPTAEKGSQGGAQDYNVNKEPVLPSFTNNNQFEPVIAQKNEIFQNAQPIVQNAEPIITISAVQSRYAPAERGAFIEDRKVVDRAMDKLPIILNINSNSPDTATFSLYSGVNQAWLIKVGLEKLNEYFDFKMPLSQPVAVAAAEPGRLTRQGEGWLVTNRAKLNVR